LTENRYKVPALERGKIILDLVAQTRQAMTASELSRKTGIAKSTLHGICQTLVDLELLVRRRDQTFQIGPHVMRWANAFSSKSDVTAEFSAIWDTETTLPGATITLSVMEGQDVVYIAARNSEVNTSLFRFGIGARLPAAFTATGKAFLSYMTNFEVMRLYAGSFPAPRTPHSVRSVEALLKELETIRHEGYSIDDQQVAEGMVCIGSAVLDASNRPLAGVAVSLPAEDLSMSKRENLVEDITRLSRSISHRMGAELPRQT
jgi:DNA-binding IclR family transcriptional regulator